MTGYHAEAQSRAAKSSGIWELWTVISPKFSTHFVLTTVVSNIIYGSSSPDVQQLGLPGLRPGRSQTAWVLALLITSLLAHNKLYILYFVGASSPTQPDLNQSSSPAFRREKLLRYLLHRGTAGIQQNLQFGVRCVVKAEERETARRSAKDSASPERHFGLEREPPLEPWQAMSGACTYTERDQGTSHRLRHPSFEGELTTGSRRAQHRSQPLVRRNV